MNINPDDLYGCEDDEVFRAIDSVALEQAEARLLTSRKTAKIHLLVKDNDAALKSISIIRSRQKDFLDALHNYHEGYNVEMAEPSASYFLEEIEYLQILADQNFGEKCDLGLIELPTAIKPKMIQQQD